MEPIRLYLNGYTLKRIGKSGMWFVDGACGCLVAHGNTPEEAVDKAIVSIRSEVNRRLNGGIGKQSWFYGDESI